MHLDLPQDPGDFRVGHGHEHHVMDSEKRHQHQRGLEQLPERRKAPSISWRGSGGATAGPGQGLRFQRLPVLLPGVQLPRVRAPELGGQNPDDVEEEEEVHLPTTPRCGSVAHSERGPAPEPPGMRRGSQG